ncbi:MAG: TonB-dependent receptor [Colwellia polaris]|jgi:TonB-dependent receptor|uniref:TonB-dependent receptor n=1 Tax=Colwellia polaris TaxID=326537 RepID=UPI000A16EA71|nr:TonB-dependent receptor [Colwellia polaris]|tara:strand:- start:25729 stop:28473 length:2745 start_codon:yes stop_codon:yes gene_type:complete
MSTKVISTLGKRTAIALAVASTFTNASAFAQDAPKPTEVITVTGMLSSLKSSMLDKKESNVVSDGISAEDLGKFPDLNVAESLQRITGVSIDRSGGEGQAVTVRGFGPQFNTVLVNGRQLATDSAGREFNFDVLAADQITGADVFKTTSANLQEGGIGGTINVSTARPFDYEGFQVVGSLKGMYESLSEETSPAASLLVSNTFHEDRLGVLLAVSHSERDVQINRIETAGWRPGQTISNDADGDGEANVLFTNAYIPRNWDQIVDQQERTRTNASLVLQYAPTDEIEITVDGYMSKFEVKSEVTDLASWFEPDRVDSATIDAATGTLTSFNQGIGLSGPNGSGNPATDFVSHTRNSRDVTNEGFGINVQWDITDQLVSTFDLSTSTAENDRAGRDRFNVVGIINNYAFDGTGSLPTVIHDGFGGGNLPDANLSRLHYNEKGNQFTDKDDITEFKADFVYSADGDVFEQARFGLYRQEREKESFQIFGNQCQFCGYGEAAPNDILDFKPFTANNYFSGLIDTFYAYDGDAYVDFLASQGFPIEPTLQNNRYKVSEDITSLYADFTFGYDVGDMPLTVNIGARYSTTDVNAAAVQSDIANVVPTTDQTLFSNVFGPANDINESGSYSNLLPSVNVKLGLQDDMVLRFAVYDSLTRPTLSQLSPATTYNEPRRQNLTAQGGNPNLKPFTSENWDISYEWYYSDASLFSFAFFHKEVDDFIVTSTSAETFTLADRTGPDFACEGANCSDADELNGEQEVYTVTRPQNTESITVTGYEIALTHIFENGFGFTANATIVDSDQELGDDPTKAFALEGLGDSQNLIMFYEADTWQARVAYNNREGFLRLVDNGFNGEPVNTETFGQWDVSASYDVNENISVFFEGINVTEEELVQTGRFANQAYNIEDNGSRYAIGVRGKF